MHVGTVDGKYDSFDQYSCWLPIAEVVEEGHQDVHPDVQRTPREHLQADTTWKCHSEGLPIIDALCIMMQVCMRLANRAVLACDDKASKSQTRWSTMLADEARP